MDVVGGNNLEIMFSSSMYLLVSVSRAMEEANMIPFLTGTWFTSDDWGLLLESTVGVMVGDVLLFDSSIFFRDIIMALNMSRLSSEFFLISFISFLVTSVELCTSFFISLTLLSIFSEVLCTWSNTVFMEVTLPCTNSREAAWAISDLMAVTTVDKSVI